MVLSCGNSTIKTRLMQIRRGIFQGDSLSPLLFCMALNSLSKELNAGRSKPMVQTSVSEIGRQTLVLSSY